MNILKHEIVLSKGEFSENHELNTIIEEIMIAIKVVVWPPGNNKFEINPVKKGNGVKPIKNSCVSCLKENFGWQPEFRMPISGKVRPGPIDAVKKLNNEQYYAFEWETGNISSTHRGLNKIALGILKGQLAGGTLVLPSRRFCRFLTDRVGNFSEIEPYLLIWQKLPVDNGYISIIEIEYDAENDKIPKIEKGTDGRALYQVK